MHNESPTSISVLFPRPITFCLDVRSVEHGALDTENAHKLGTEMLDYQDRKNGLRDTLEALQMRSCSWQDATLTVMLRRF